LRRAGKIVDYVIKIRIPNWLELILAGPVLLYPRLRFGFAFREIPLTQGKYAIVDPDDYYRLREYKWYVSRRYYKSYAARKIPNRKGKK
jgi:hypothetical protein